MTSRPSHNLREFIRNLDEQDCLEVIEGADWHLEIGGITELTWRRKREDSPALLFDRINDYRPGQRVLTLGVASTFSYTIGSNLKPTKNRREAIRQLKDRSFPEPISTEQRAEGEVLENVLGQDDIDVLEFPVPKYKKHDGGRYIGTGDMVLTRHAETGEINVGTYRVQVQGPKTVTVQTSPGRDGYAHIKSFHERHEAAPVLISIGQAPDLFLAACERFSRDVNELEVVGGRREEPVQVVPGELTELPMPASSELVLEGHVYPDAQEFVEGPFGEFMGYYAGLHEKGNPGVHTMEVERIYHRDNPIIFGVPHHRPPQDVLLDYRMAPALWNELEATGIPGIHEVNSLPFGSGMCNVVSIDTQYNGHGKQVGMQVASSRTSYAIGHITIVVDNDINVYDQDMVLWAVLTRCNPGDDYHIIEDMPAASSDPLNHSPSNDDSYPRRDRLIIDATKPYDWKDDFPSKTDIDDALKNKILENWGEFFQGL